MTTREWFDPAVVVEERFEGVLVRRTAGEVYAVVGDDGSLCVRVVLEDGTEYQGVARPLAAARAEAAA